MAENELTAKKRREASARRTCPYCGRAFKRTEHLERHKRTRELVIYRRLFEVTKE